MSGFAFRKSARPDLQRFASTGRGFGELRHAALTLQRRGSTKTCESVSRRLYIVLEFALAAGLQESAREEVRNRTKPARNGKQARQKGGPEEMRRRKAEKED